MIKPAPPKSRGIAGVLFVFLLGVATAGLLIDLLVLTPARGASVFAAPGGRAALGAAVAVSAVIVTFVLRWAMGRPFKGEEGARVRDHS